MRWTTRSESTIGLLKTEVIGHEQKIWTNW
jgi:hypothetical protein